MAPPAVVIEQNLINMRASPRIEVETCLETALTAERIATLLGEKGSGPRAIGLASGYTPAGKLTILAAAVKSRVLLIQFRNKSKKDSDAVVAARKLLQDELLSNEDNNLFAFDMAIVAADVYYEARLRVNRAFDIQDACACKDNRVPLNAVTFALTSTSDLGCYAANVTNIFGGDSVWDPSKSATTTALALRAWLSSYVPTIPDMEERYRDAKPINLKSTEKWPEPTLVRYTEWASTDRQLDMKKALATQHDFTTVGSSKNKLMVEGDRFQNRIRNSNAPVKTVVTDQHGAQYTTSARLSEVKGRMATLKGSGIMEGKTVSLLATVGRDGPTSAEKSKAAALLRIFQEASTVTQNPFSRLIWPDGGTIEWPEALLVLDDTPTVTYDFPLNDSQLRVVQNMLSLTNSTRITIAQGPPGTGKTTVIGAFVQSAITAGLDGIWLVAQSNVAVKNIAEKLLKIGFTQWKVLVSLDFHEGWHEHLYKEFPQHVIRSDEFRNASHEIQGCKVLLCTVSMLSNQRLDKFTAKLPIKTLVIDEASQINVNDYVSLLEKFPSLHKLCFIGDDKQLPPYGQEEIDDLKSIFEIAHLRKEALFLDTQYRMPPHIGEFISDAVYDGQLRSNPEHPVKQPACWFIDVADGVEHRNGTSFENLAERQVIVKMAEFLQEDGEQFRVITPYDAQRTALENDFKAAGLEWRDKCFNVDSFQGNEEDVIIISVVRSQGLGFLRDLRRTNVMLSRCKKAMYICSSWDFLVGGVGANSLVGRLASHCKDDAWIPAVEALEGNF